LDQEGKPLADPVKHEVGEVEKVDNTSSTTQVSTYRQAFGSGSERFRIFGVFGSGSKSKEHKLFV